MGVHWENGRRFSERYSIGRAILTPIGATGSWLYSLHLRPRPAKKDDDGGHEHLVFLAGLVLTYGIALTLTEQGKGVRPAAIAIFSVVSILTIAGLWLMLRCVDSNDADAPRAFRPSTIRFGEWAITFSIFVFVGFFAFAAFGILPGQGGRAIYKPGTLPTTTYHWNQNPIAGSNLSNTAGKNAIAQHERQRMFEHTGDQLDREIQQENNSLMPPGSRKKLFYVEQDVPFDEDFHPFQLRFSLKKDYEVVDAFGVLVSSDPSWAKMRPLHFPRDEEHGDAKILGDFMVDDPDKGETLHIAVVVQTRDATKRFPKDDFRPEDIGLILRREGE